MTGTRGPGRVCAVLPTPFRPGESLDLDGIARLVDWELERGVDSVAILGFAGEVLRLSDAERGAVLDATVRAVAGRVPVIAGVAGGSTHAVRGYAAEAVARGADALMVPPPLRAPSAECRELSDYFGEVAEAGDVMLQDEPENSGVRMPAAVIAQIMDDHTAVRWAKVEEPPCARKIAAIRAALRREDTGLYGGRGGLELLDELAAGSAGVTTGFAYPEVLVTVVRHWFDGEREAAIAAYRDRLPALLFESQKDIGLAIRKETLRRRGALASATVRRPGRPWTADLDDGRERWAPEPERT